MKAPLSRRLIGYWILLIGSTLVVGAGALLLLRREQVSLAERSASAEEARRAAATTRTGLIAENAGLLVGDVQTGLLDTLAAAPASGLDAFLAEWERTNPLVETAFRADVSGALLRPSPTSRDVGASSFIRRFAAIFGEERPWDPDYSDNDALKDLPLSTIPSASDESAQRESEKVSYNVVQAQSARRDVQELARQSLPVSSAATGLAAAEMRAESYADQAAAAAEPTVSRALLDDAAGKSGWLPAVADGQVHLFGWLQRVAGGEVRGLEVNLDTLVQALAGSLPALPDANAGFAIRDGQARIHHQVGTIPAGIEPDIRIPLTALPGWEAVAYLGASGSVAASGGFVTLGMGLIVVLVAAILAAGSLLLWQARASEAEAAQKSSFVSNVSHEFKTPLTTIRLYAELLEQGRVRDESQGREYLQTIGREIQRLSRLVGNVLDFSRLEQGRKKFSLEEIDLGTELARILEASRLRLEEAGLELVRRLPARPLIVQVDRDALEQIVLNLLDNACKYAAEGKLIEVSAAARPAGGVEIRVRDHGPGVPADHRERIFEKFHRVDDALTAERAGAGLGLGISRQLARGLDGELRCESVTDGPGAVFVLELP